MEGEGQGPGRAEQEVDAEGRRLSGHRDLGPPRPGAGGEVAPLVELAVARQIGLGDHAEDPALADHDGGVVEPARPPQRRADHDDREDVSAGLEKTGDRGFHRVQDRVLEQEVVDGVGR